MAGLPPIWVGPRTEREREVGYLCQAGCLRDTLDDLEEHLNAVVGKNDSCEPLSGGRGREV